ncbi:MAG: WD40 repeat domain-containing protein [Kouleothrix sp.]|nr:WD40 repeat domain-containing protein [Kouleothrix sp.]
MNDQIAPPLADEAAFASLAALKAAHADLLQRRRAGPETPALLDDIATLVRRGQGTGVLLDDDDERAAAQSLLNYWANILYRAGREPPDATLAEFDPRLAPKLPDELCPYLGLEAFRENNHDLFFGRQQLVDELVERLKTHRLLAVVGSSGSGKSSLVRAGLIPALRSGALPGSAGWRYCPTIVPGSEPLATLERALRAAALAAPADGAPDPQAPLVLVIDQFEELFTLCADEREREAFAGRLLELAESPGPRHTVILTMRSDFEENVAKLPALRERFDQARVQVTALGASELRAAIEEPARRVGLKFEAGIVDELVRDILGERVGLPLLQFTLLKLWEQRDRNRVTWESYRRVGSAREALARSADAFYRGLLPEEQVTAKRILLRMVRPGAGLEVTSNRIRRETLYAAGEARDRVDRVLDKLIAARLVRLCEGETPGDVQVEVAHEALIRNWPRLVDWLEQERESLRRRLRLTEAAEQWQALDRDPAALLRGTVLEEARGYDDLSPLEAAFVEAGQAAQDAAEREREAARRRQLRYTRRIAAALAVLLILAVVATISTLRLQTQTAESASNAGTQAAVANTAKAAAIIAKNAAEDARATAVVAQAHADAAREAQLLAFQALSAPDPELGLLLAIAAAKRSPGSLVEDALRQAIQNSHIRLRMAPNAGPLTSALWSPDQRRILTIGRDRFLRVWDASTGQLQLTLCCHEQDGQVDSSALVEASWSPDSQRILTLSEDGSARVWLAKTGEPLRMPGEQPGPIAHAAWRPGGEQILLATEQGARIWDVAGGQPPRALGDETTPAVVAVWRPDGAQALTVDAAGNAAIWDAASGARLAGFDAMPGRFDQAQAASWSPDGQRLLTAGVDGAIRYWDVSGALLGTLDDSSGFVAVSRAGRPLNPINLSPSFSPDGQRVVAAGADGVARIWSVATATAGGSLEPELKLTGHTGPIAGASWSADGRRIVTGSADKTARVWDAASGNELLALRGHTGGVSSAAWSPDDQRILTASDDGSARVWSANLGEERLVQRGPANTIVAAAFSHDRDTLAWGGFDGTIWLWRVSDGKLLLQLERHSGPVRSLAFSSDSQFLASGGGDGKAIVWRVADGALVREFQVAQPVGGLPIGVNAVAFAPDLQLVATVSAEGALRLWRVDDGRSIAEQPGRAASIAFSPDGKLMAVGGMSGGITFHDPTSLALLPGALSGPVGALSSLAFSADGATLAGGGEDAAIAVWDVAGRKARGDRLVGHAGAISGLVWSDDGARLLSSSADGTARVWSVAGREQLSVLRGGSAGIAAAAWDSREERIMAAGLDGELRLYAASLDDLIALAQTRTTRQLDPQELSRALGGALSPGTSPTSLPASATAGPPPQVTKEPVATVAPGAIETPAPLPSWAQVLQLKHPSGVRGAAFSPDGKLIATASEDGRVRLWSAADGSLTSTLVGHTDVVGAVAFSPDGRLLASASDDNTARLWDVATGQELRVLAGHSAQVWAVAFSPDGQVLATGSNDNTVRLWSLADGTALHTLKGHTVGVWSVAFSPDGATLASVASDNPALKETDVRLWSVGDGQPLGVLSGHTRGVLCVAFSPDGATLASGSVDRTIVLWDVAARQSVRVLQGHDDNVYSVAFAPDGRTLASGSLDNTVRLWSVASGAQLQLLRGHAGRVWSVAFAPDGKTVASASADGTVRLWRAR